MTPPSKNKPDQAPQYVAVAVPTPVRSLFHYEVPRDLAGKSHLKRGSRVRVPFGNRRLIGVVTSLNTQPDIAVSRIKKLVEVLDPSGDMVESILHLAEWSAGYYEHPIGDVISNALPGGIRHGWNPLAPISKLTITDAGDAAGDDYLRRAPAQKHLLELLREKPLNREKLAKEEVAQRTIKTLVDKAWACWEEEPPPPMPPFSLQGINRHGIEMTDEQADAVSRIDAPGPYLLQGITGSGKTEVYLRMIEPLLQSGRQVLVLVPEIGLTPQTVARFQDRFDVPIAVMHSSLSDRERSENWLKSKLGNVGILLGTRSAIFTPMQRPGAIIVDEEHDASYKQQDGFRYSARDLAVLRGQFEKIPVVLGSATPSLESLHNVESGKYTHLQLTTRPPGARSESYEVIDTRHLEVTNGFTRSLRHAISDELNAGNQVLVFLNRRGFAPVMMCSDCNWIAHCRRCDARLTYHLSMNTLVCHHCGTMNHNIISCQSCGSSRVTAIGLGTQRIEQTLKEMFPGTRIMRIDRDSTRRKGAMQDFIDEIATGEPAILVGTQLLAKGHHFPDVTLVALLDADAGFYSSDFRAIERLGQLILQVGGRAGRADKPGRVMIQTEFASHQLLQTLIKTGYAAFAEALLKERRELDLPPYTFSVLIRAEAHDASAAREFLEAILKSTRPHPSVNLLGPVPALMEKKAGRYRQLLMLSSAQRQHLHQDLRKVISVAESIPGAGRVRWSIDVDPGDIF